MQWHLISGLCQVRTRLAYMTEDGGRQALRPSGSPTAAATVPATAAGCAPRSPLQQPAGMTQQHSTTASGPQQRSSSSPGASRTLPSQPLTMQQRLTIRSMLRTTFQREGFRGLYHGIGPTLVGIVPYAGLKFYVYQARRMHVARTSGRCPCFMICMLDITRLFMPALCTHET